MRVSRLPARARAYRAAHCSAFVSDDPCLALARARAYCCLLYLAVECRASPVPRLFIDCLLVPVLISPKPKSSTYSDATTFFFTAALYRPVTYRWQPVRRTNLACTTHPKQNLPVD